jgi:hypothetical protein
MLIPVFMKYDLLLLKPGFAGGDATLAIRVETAISILTTI